MDRSLRSPTFSVVCSGNAPRASDRRAVRIAARETIYRLEKQDANWTAVGVPGDYVVTAEFAGYAQPEATVTVTPPAPEGRILGNAEVHLTFEQQE